MQFSRDVETYTTDDQRWLGSRHGTEFARTVTIDGASLADFIDDGFVPSGIPLKVGAGGKYEPVGAVDDVLAGFLLTPQALNGGGDVIAPMLDRGRVRATRMPEKAFDITTLAAANPLFVVQGD